MLYQSYVPPHFYAYFQQPQPQIYRPVELPNLSISLKLPTYSYNTTKTVCVPFDINTSNNGHFASIDDAMRYISKHCLKHHKQFTRQLAKQYSQFCFILDFTTSQYLPLTECSKREFNTAFNKVSKFIY